MKFGEKLSLFLKQRNMRIVELSNFVDLDRSNLYKIVNGSRKLPDKSYIQTIAEILCLTKEEIDELNQAYEIDEVGSYIYYRRKKVEEILELSVSWDIGSPIGGGVIMNIILIFMIPNILVANMLLILLSARL